MPQIEFKQGSVLDATEQYIAHQTNCTSKLSAGLAKSVFQKWPDSNLYKARVAASVPGTINVFGTSPQVICMNAQYYPGKPNQSNDTETNRLDWFRSCLEHIGSLNPESVAFPHRIGCGLAGGNWDSYMSVIRDFAAGEKIRIAVYQQE